MPESTSHAMSEHIAEVAGILFQCDGYDHVNDHDLAFHASVTEATVQYFYPDRTVLARMFSQRVMESCIRATAYAERRQPPTPSHGEPTASQLEVGRLEVGRVLRTGQIFFNAMRSDRLSSFARDTMATEGTIAFDAPWITTHMPHLASSERTTAKLTDALSTVCRRVSSDLHTRCMGTSRPAVAHDGMDVLMIGHLMASGVPRQLAEEYVNSTLLAGDELTPLTHRALAMLR